MIINKKFVAVLFFAGFLLAGCSIKKTVVNSTALFMDDVVNAFLQENDVEFAAEAIPANLKLIDGLIQASDNENEDLLLKGCKLYGMYAMGYLEDSTTDEKKDRENSLRAKNFYKRAQEYGMAVLKKNHDFKKLMDEGGDLDAFKKMMLAFNKDDVEALFWTAFAWSSYINLSKDSPEDVADLPRAKALIDRVIELNDKYFYGIPHLFMIAYYSMPKMFGGDFDKAKQEYEKEKEISGGKFVLADFYMAKYYAVGKQDKKLFDELITSIRETKDDVIPENLLTLMAKRKAEVLAEKMAGYF